ncbi:MAG: mandelate racemase/muconate lactonizing enzyme family protein [Spirochaetaceae bacterium]|nr:MAG: mandelate racemase/muconate lactonizing enzyme family protein [Spirochaetaceae bacterium]
MTSEGIERVENAVNRASSPSDLRITDMRTAVVASNYDYPIIRIDTNQGVYGIGEVRDAGHRENALQFKSLLLGRNPCDVDLIFRAMKQFGNWGREGGGVSGIEIALWDLVGKVYGVPAYQFLGGKYRDKVRIYADTPEPDDPTPESYVKTVGARLAQGLTFIKFDILLSALDSVDGGRIGTATKHERPRPRSRRTSGSGPVVTVSDRGIARLAEIVAAVREEVGWGISLCIDHYGHGAMTVKEVIRLARAIEPYGLAWMEDPVPWWDIESHRRVTEAVGVPIAAGEELYLWEGFREMIETRAVDIVHPDLLTSGGIAETKRIGDYAERYNIPTALHFAGSPIAFMANVHCAAALSNFVALEHHGLDLPFWEGLVTGLPSPLMEGGYVTVPDRPGLGVDLNLDAIAENLRAPSGLFEPTDDWNTPKLGFWQP